MMKITFVDEEDNIIGAGSGKEAREKGIHHRVSRIFLFNSRGELLIQKRADNFKWDQSAAGHVDKGEDYATTAKRELEEEIGVKDLELIEKAKFFTDEKDRPGEIVKRFNMLYVGIYNGDLKLDPKEVVETQWINLDKLTTWMNRKPKDFTEGFLKNFKYLQSI